MKIVKIGKENATFQEILALKENRTKRFASKKFFVEGVQNIKDAIANNWNINSFIFSNYNALSNWAKSVLNNAEICYEIAPNLMEKLSDKEETSELLAIIEMKEQSCNIEGKENPLFLLFDRPSKKGNLGTIIRSSDALYVDQIFFTGHSVDIYDHNVITTSMGSFFKVPFKFLESNSEFENLVVSLKNLYPNLQIVATSLQTENSLEKCNFKLPTLLLVGNEAKGLSKFYIDKADKLVKIDMNDNIDSLNVACATSICLYEISRQRK